MSKNSVFINEYDVVEIVVNGDQTVDSVQAMGDEATKLLRKLRADSKPQLLLDNLFFVGSLPFDARRRVVDLVKAGEFERFAVVGRGTAMRLGANLLIQAIGRGRQVRYFENYMKAIAWLRGKQEREV